METLVSFERAREHVLSDVPRLDAEPVALLDAAGRTLARDAVSPRDLPPHANSALDGFAVRRSDLLGAEARPLTVDGTAWPGEAPGPPLARLGARRIMTGAPLPPGADAVVPVEWTRLDSAAWRALGAGDSVTAARVPEAGHGVRPRAGDVARGQTLARAGALITPARVGLLAGAGVTQLTCARRPRVVVVATGSEVVPHGQDAGPNRLPDANGPLLLALLREAGAAATLRHARDEGAELEHVLDGALSQSDVLLVTGGVSMGAADDVPDVLGRLGVELAFHRVRQRPGKPLAFGRRGGVLVFGLPGNPVSTAVCFQIYVRPLLRAMMGARPPALVPVVLGEAFSKTEGLHTFARVRMDYEAGRAVARSAGGQASNQLHALAAADGLAHLPSGWSEAPAGADVQVERL